MSLQQPEGPAQIASRSREAGACSTAFMVCCQTLTEQAAKPWALLRHIQSPCPRLQSQPKIMDMLQVNMPKLSAYQPRDTSDTSILVEELLTDIAIARRQHDTFWR